MENWFLCYYVRGNAQHTHTHTQIDVYRTLDENKIQMQPVIILDRQPDVYIQIMIAGDDGDLRHALIPDGKP